MHERSFSEAGVRGRRRAPHLASKRVALALATLLLLGFGAVGCGDDDPSQPAPTGAAGEAGASSSAGEGGASTSGGAGGSEPAPSAPRLERVEKMAGNLHVFWALPEGMVCDEIEGERKTDVAPYAVVFRVPGAARDRHDGTADDDTTYTYRLRCKAGGAYSAYSDERSGNPVGP